MTYNKRSTFTWSFTGWETKAEADKKLEEMQEWFRKTYEESEWEVRASVYNTPYGFGASLNAARGGNGLD